MPKVQEAQAQLRQYAAAAMQVIFAEELRRGIPQQTHAIESGIAERAWSMAEAMLCEETGKGRIARLLDTQGRRQDTTDEVGREQ